MNSSRLASRFASAVIAILANLTAAATSPASEATSFSPTDQKVIIATALEVEKAILAEDVSDLLRLVTRTEGLTCTDTLYSFKEIRAFLADKQSDLYLSLFRSDDFGKKCGEGYPLEYPAISEKDFLQTADKSFSVIRLEADWAKVIIKSPVKTHYPREWYFHREGRTWKLAGASFIIGNCTCG